MSGRGEMRAATRPAPTRNAQARGLGPLWLLLAILTPNLGATGCLRDEVVAELDGPIAVEWLIKTELGGGGRGIGLREFEAFRFTRPQQFDVVLDGYWTLHRARRVGPQLAASPSGVELAYRGSPAEPWRVAYLSKAAPRAFPHCSLTLGSNQTPEWSRLVSFDRTAPDLLQCLHLSRPLFEEVRARGGDRALADLVITAREGFIQPTPYARSAQPAPYDNWEWAVDSLPPPERGRVVDVLRRDLTTAGSSTAALTRALWRVDPIDASLLSARARELAARRDRDLLPVLLARLAPLQRAEAGAVACTTLASSFPEQWPSSMDLAALAVIASTKAPCPAVVALLLERPDDPSYDFGGDGDVHLRTEQDLAPQVEAHLRSVATDRQFYFQHSDLDGFEALLAAGYAQGTLPGPVVEAAERRRLLRESCAAFFAWRLRSQREVDAFVSTAEWNAARTNAELAAVRRKRAKAHRALSKRAPELAHPTLREIEVRWNECASRWAARYDEEAAAYETGDQAMIAATADLWFQMYMECGRIDGEGGRLCTH
jgi:hypothetical protein